MATSFGNVQKTGKYSWKLTVSAGFDGGGKRIRHTKTVKVTNDNLETQEKEARKELALFIKEVESGNTSNSGKLKVRDFANQWYNEHVTKELAPKTQQTYKTYIDQRIIPALGNIYLDKLKPLQVIAFLNNLREEGMRLDGKPGSLSNDAILYCFRVLASMLTDAVQWQLIPTNPCDRVKPPTAKKSRKSSQSFNEDQTARLLEILETEPLKDQLMVVLALATGLRRGELCGLEWNDFNLKENTLTVNRASQSLSGHGTFDKNPKNESSNRTITIPSGIVPLLKEYKAWQSAEKLRLGDKWNRTDKLFTAWNGEPMHVDTPTKWFKKFLIRYNRSIDENVKLTEQQKKELKLPAIRFHDLRHTSGSLLIAKGVPLKNVSSRLGHADIRTTANIYSHALQSVDKQIADTMDGIMFAKTKKA